MLNVEVPWIPLGLLITKEEIAQQLKHHGVYRQLWNAKADIPISRYMDAYIEASSR